MLTRNWVMAKLKPVARHAGQTSRMAFHPAITTTSQNGTITEKKGSWRPTMAESWSSGRFVTALSAMMGVPSAP